MCFRAIKIFVDLVTGAQSENLLRILWHEIPQRVILRCEKRERCERDINHMCKINASCIRHASAPPPAQPADQFSYRDESPLRPERFRFFFSQHFKKIVGRFKGHTIERYNEITVTNTSIPRLRIWFH